MEFYFVTLITDYKANMRLTKKRANKRIIKLPLSSENKISNDELTKYCTTGRYSLMKKNNKK